MINWRDFKTDKPVGKHNFDRILTWSKRRGVDILYWFPRSYKYIEIDGGMPEREYSKEGSWYTLDGYGRRPSHWSPLNTPNQSKQ